MKKVLIITYYWPPAGGPGVQRIVKFTRELPNFDWQPIILTVEEPSSPARDESLLDHVPKSCKVYRTKTLEPFTIYKYFTGKDKNKSLPKDTIIKHSGEKVSEKISRIIRANIFLPDARVGWIPSMVKQGLRIIQEEKPKIIFSTSPPHSLQLGAKRLAKKSGLKWIADFRDPWIEAYWEKDIERIGFSSRLNKNMEIKVLKNANIITTVSDGICDHLRAKVDNQFETIYTGMDVVNVESVSSDHFEIVYFGNMSQMQSPEPVFKALDSLPSEKKSLIKFIFIGNVYRGFDDLLNNYPDIKVETRDYLPRDEMMRTGKSASILLLINLDIVYGKGLMTAKIFDYLSLRKPILAIADKGGSLNEALDQTESGRVFSKEDIKDISLFIKQHLDIWMKGPAILLDDTQKLNPYRTKNNVEKLTRLFDQISESGEG